MEHYRLEERSYTSTKTYGQEHQRQEYKRTEDIYAHTHAGTNPKSASAADTPCIHTQINIHIQTQHT